MLYQAPFDYKTMEDMIQENPESKLLLKSVEKLDDGYFNGHLLLDKLIKNSNVDALLLSALYSKKDESESDFIKRHLHILEKLSELNHPLALYGLGVYYDKGELLPEDKEKAIHFFKKSANLKNPQSNFIYGVMLYYGAEGINININEAFDRLQYAVSMGVKEAEEFIKFINEV